MIATLDKRTVSAADLDAEAGFVLPARETMLITVVITNLLNNLSVDIDVRNNKVAVQICAVVQALNTILVGQQLTCEVEQ